MSVLSVLALAMLALAAIACLVSLVFGILALVGKGHPAGVSFALWALPAAGGVLVARWGTDAAAQSAIADRAWFDWMARVGPESADLWSTVGWVGGALLVLPLLPLLLAAIAGALRGPRRLWLAGAQLGWSLLGAVIALPLVLMSVPDLPIYAVSLPVLFVVLGLMVAVASLAGREDVGPSAASLAASCAAASMVGSSLMLLAYSQFQVLSAISMAPMRVGAQLIGGGQAVHALGLLPAACLAVFAAGWIALAEGARVGGFGRWLGAATAVAAMIVLPLTVLGADAVHILGSVPRAQAQTPTITIDESVQLPEVERGVGWAQLRPGYPALLLSAEGARWLTPGQRELYLSGPPDEDLLRSRWPVEAPPPLIIDARVPTGAILQFGSAFKDPYSPMAAFVNGRGFSDEVHLDEVRFSIAQSAHLPQASLIIDETFLRAAGCLDGPCTQEAIETALPRTYRSTNQVLIDPGVPFGITAKILAIYTERGEVASLDAIRRD